jgi:hypothetical protein
MKDWTTGRPGSIPAEAKNFSSSLSVQTSSETHPASYPVGTGGRFAGDKAQPGMTLTTNLRLVPRSIMSMSYISSPPWRMHDGSRTYLLLLSGCSFLRGLSTVDVIENVADVQLFCPCQHVGPFYSYIIVEQRGPTGGPRVTSSLRPLVSRHVKLFVNVLLFTTCSFIVFAQKDLKNIAVLSRLPL